VGKVEIQVAHDNERHVWMFVDGMYNDLKQRSVVGVGRYVGANEKVSIIA